MAFDFKSFGATPDTSVKPTSSGFSMESFGEPTQTQINPQTNVTKGFLGKAADFLGIERFGRGIGQTISNTQGVQDKLIAVHDQSLAIQNQLIDKIKSNKLEGKDTTRLQKALDLQIKNNADFLNNISDVGTSGLTNKEVLGSALNTATLLTPGAGKGASLTKKIITGAATGYAMDVANDLQKNKSSSDIATPGWGTLLGGAIPLVTSIFGAGAKLEQINERLTPTEKKNLGEKGKEVAQYLVDKRVVGTPEQRLAKVNGFYNEMENKIQNVVSSTKVSYPTNEVVNALQDTKGFFLDKPAEYKNIASKLDEVASFIQEHHPDEVPANVMNEFKRSLADSAYNEKGNKVLSDGLKTASDVMYSFLQDTIPGLKPLNGEYSKIITAKNLLESASTRNQAGLFEKGAAMLTGSAVGGAIGGVGGAGVGSYVGPKAMEAAITPIRSNTAVGLNEVNKILNKIPEGRVYRIPLDKSNVIGGKLNLTKKMLIQILTK